MTPPPPPKNAIYPRYLSKERETRGRHGLGKVYRNSLYMKYESSLIKRNRLRCTQVTNMNLLNGAVLYSLGKSKTKLYSPYYGAAKFYWQQCVQKLQVNRVFQIS